MVNYVIGGFYSDGMDVFGGQVGFGSNVEYGGFGVIYLDGKLFFIKNLCIDNKGLKLLVRVFFYFFNI